MSLQTTQAQAAARAAEAAWSRHKGDCSACGTRLRGARTECKTGRQLHADALELRNEAKESARLDKDPSDNDMPLFGLDELT